VAGKHAIKVKKDELFFFTFPESLVDLFRVDVYLEFPRGFSRELYGEDKFLFDMFHFRDLGFGRFDVFQEVKFLFRVLIR
jgi:hypothetical protein